MNTKIEELHSKAMDIADDAFIARRKGLFEQAKQLSKQALSYEKEAALLVNEFEIEPTRSVLFRSAGWLAFNAGEYDTAKVMVNYAFQGHPPSEIKEELYELSKAIKAIEKKAFQYQSFVKSKSESLSISHEVKTPSYPFYKGKQSEVYVANDENYSEQLAA